MPPLQSEPACKHAAQNGAYDDGEASTDADVPDRRQIEEEARVGGQPAKESGDDEDADDVVRIAVAKRAAQQPRRQVYANEIDGK